MSQVTKTIVTTIEDADGWKRVGALTTTFRPPASCTKILSTTSSSLAFIGPEIFDRDSCYPDTDGVPLIRAYFQPGLVCPSGWTGENMFGGTRGTDPMLVLPSLRPDETAVVCCPSGLSYAETLLSFAPGVGGWCLGTLTAPTSIEAEECANCDDGPTLLPIRNANNIAMTLVQTTILLRSETEAKSSPTLSAANTGDSTNNNSTNTNTSNGDNNISGSNNNTTNDNNPATDPPAANTAAIVAGVVASVLALACIAAAIFLFMRRRRRRQQQHQLTILPLGDEPKELHSTSSGRTELLGDTNPSMGTHELGTDLGPVELDATPRYAMPPPAAGGGSRR